METVNKVYHAASHAVWGEEDEERKSGEEPVSGETGQGTATDPYDAGNMEEQETTEGPTEQTSSTPQDNTSTQEKTPSSTKGSVDPKNTFAPSSQRADPDAPSNATYPVASGIVGDPSSGTGSVSKHQGADKPSDKPSDEQVSHIQNRKSAAEDVQSPALGKEESISGGDTATSQRLGEQDTSTQQSNVPGQHETGTGSGQSTQKTEAESGAASGEKYVKSSGFAAEGGDFDATQPGAGREADRLLEHHGEDVHTGEGGHTGMADDHSTDQNSHGKPKMVSRMKDKLHIGKHHDVKV